MIVEISCNQYWNEKTLWKEQNPEYLQGFVREVRNKGLRINDDRIMVDFRTKPGTIMVHSYPPVITIRNMKRMHVKQLYDKEWIRYRDELARYRKSGGIKVREQDPFTGQVTTHKFSESGLILPQ